MRAGLFSYTIITAGQKGDFSGKTSKMAVRKSEK